MLDFIGAFGAAYISGWGVWWARGSGWSGWGRLFLGFSMFLLEEPQGLIHQDVQDA